MSQDMCVFRIVGKKTKKYKFDHYEAHPPFGLFATYIALDLACVVERLNLVRLSQHATICPRFADLDKQSQPSYCTVDFAICEPLDLKTISQIRCSCVRMTPNKIPQLVKTQTCIAIIAAHSKPLIRRELSSQSFSLRSI